jgi:hypothetical protein
MVGVFSMTKRHKDISPSLQKVSSFGRCWVSGYCVTEKLLADFDHSLARGLREANNSGVRYPWEVAVESEIQVENDSRKDK